ncbi:hypothetical protein HDU83_000930 [Entophlyctis luteolus]|nr:hypothetical protein HDU83_000930 [Entophlyctis luteolus]
MSSAKSLLNFLNVRGLYPAAAVAVVVAVPLLPFAVGAKRAGELRAADAAFPGPPADLPLYDDCVIAEMRLDVGSMTAVSLGAKFTFIGGEALDAADAVAPPARITAGFVANPGRGKPPPPPPPVAAAARAFGDTSFDGVASLLGRIWGNFDVDDRDAVLLAFEFMLSRFPPTVDEDDVPEEGSGPDAAAAAIAPFLSVAVYTSNLLSNESMLDRALVLVESSLMLLWISFPALVVIISLPKTRDEVLYAANIQSSPRSSL